MQCRYCGAALVPGTSFCPNCSRPVESNNSEFSSYEDDSNIQLAPYPPTTPVIESSSAPASPEQPAGMGQQQPTQQGYSGQQWGPNAQQYPSPQGYANPQYYQGTWPPGPGNFQFPNVMQPQFQPAPIPLKKGGLSPAIVVLLVVLALLVGGGAVFAFSVLSQHNSQQTQTTPDPQQLYTQATSGTPALLDPLNSSNPNGWQSVNSTSTCTFSENTLHAGASAAGTGKLTEALCAAASTSFNNFAYQVSTSISQGNITGIAFRVDPYANGAYNFGISSIGNYVLVATQADSSGKTSSKILSDGTSEAINTGANQSNVLTVIARGTTIDIYVNQQHLASVTDSAASGGVIGVFGEDTNGGAVDVIFDSIKVWRL